MFCRSWSALPADPYYPPDLRKLGYFVNNNDEVRNVENPSYYFHYYLTKNTRWNERQRFAFNQATQRIIHERLLAAGLEKLLLAPHDPTSSAPQPLTTTDPTTPHVPIFVSPLLSQRKRIVLIVGESSQDLGVLAQRVVGGSGGISKGSVISIVEKLARQHVSSADPAPPAIVIANTGELVWWPGSGTSIDRDGDGPRSMTPGAFAHTPLPNAVHAGREIDEEENRVRGHETPDAHVRRVFEDVLALALTNGAMLDVIALSDSAPRMLDFLGDEKGWARWGSHMQSLALIGAGFRIGSERTECVSFQKFLRERTRFYTLNSAPLGTVLAGPDDYPLGLDLPPLPCPKFSCGGESSSPEETLLIKVADIVLAWIQDIADTPEYKNPAFTVPSEAFTDVQVGYDSQPWESDGVPEEEKIKGWNEGASITPTAENQVETKDDGTQGQAEEKSVPPEILGGTMMEQPVAHNYDEMEEEMELREQSHDDAKAKSEHDEPQPSTSPPPSPPPAITITDSPHDTAKPDNLSDQTVSGEKNQVKTNGETDHAKQSPGSSHGDNGDDRAYDDYDDDDDDDGDDEIHSKMLSFFAGMGFRPR